MHVIRFQIYISVVSFVISLCPLGYPNDKWALWWGLLNRRNLGTGRFTMLVYTVSYLYTVSLRREVPTFGLVRPTRSVEPRNEWNETTANVEKATPTAKRKTKPQPTHSPDPCRQYSIVLTGPAHEYKYPTLILVVAEVLILVLIVSFCRNGGVVAFVPWSCIPC